MASLYFVSLFIVISLFGLVIPKPETSPFQNSTTVPQIVDISTSGVQIFIIVLFGLIFVSLVIYDNWKGGCIVKLKSNKNGIWS